MKRLWSRIRTRRGSRRTAWCLRGPGPCRRRLKLERLEERAVPSILFDSTSATVHDGGGSVLDNVHVDLIFWGAGWNANPGLEARMTSAVDNILAGPYLSALAQYRSNLGSGSRVGALTITNSSPPPTFTNWDVVSLLQSSINNGLVPNPAKDSQLLYVVVPQPGSATGNYWGYHSYSYSTQGRFHYAWIINDGTLDTLTHHFSHELLESVSDPDGTAIQVNPPDLANWNELADNDGQNYSYRLNNVLVSSYLSVRDHAYQVPTGQTQSFQVTGGHLTVNGDQLASADDSVTVDLSATNGVLLTLNGETVQFDPGAINGITINAGAGSDTILVKQTSAQAPVGIASNGSVAITVGNNGSLQNIRGAVTITNTAESASVALDDSSDGTPTAPTLNTVNIGGSVYDQVLGLAPAAIQYRSTDTNGVTILTGAGGTSFALAASAAHTTLAGNPSATNTLIGPRTGATWRISGLNAGTLTSGNFSFPVTFTGFQNLTGGNGTDSFVLADGQGVSGVIDGGGGGDWLDESAYNTAVAVNLTTGQATGTGGVRNIQNVLGGAANDTLTGNAAGNVLVGGAGANVLQSGSGRSLLISGAGAATITGGADDDVFVAGTTSFGLNEAALASILAEWQRTDLSPQDRLTDLQTGTAGLNGANHLVWGTTVFDNGQLNTVTGGGGQNWFFSGNLTAVTNPKPTDRVGTPVNLLFVLGLDGHVYGQRIDAHGNPAWGYFLVQPDAAKSLTTSRGARGELTLFTVGMNNRVTAFRFDTFGQLVGGSFFNPDMSVQAVSPGHDAAGNLELFAVGLDRQVYAQKFDAADNPAGAFALTAPGQVNALRVGHDAGNRPELFVMGLDGQVWAQKFDANGNSTGPYFLTQAGIVKDLRVASDAANRPELFVIGLNDHVYTQRFDASGSSTGPYALAAIGQVKALEVTQDASHQPAVFVIGLDDQVYRLGLDNTGTALGSYRPTSAGGVKAIAVGQDATSNPVLFVTGLDDQVYRQSFSGGASAGPYALTAPGRVLQIVYTA